MKSVEYRIFNRIKALLCWENFFGRGEIFFFFYTPALTEAQVGGNNRANSLIRL